MRLIISNGVPSLHPPVNRSSPSGATRSIQAVVGFALIVSLSAFAADDCPLDRAPTTHPPAPSPGPSQPTEVRADFARSEPDGTSEFTGKVQASQGTRRIAADRLRYQRDSDTAHASGDVTFIDSSGAKFHTPEIRLRLDTREGYAEGGRFLLPDNQGRGDTTRTVFEGRDLTRLHEPRYTTCPAGRDDWFLRASELTLDTAKDVGTARHARVSFFGVPLFYVPYFTFPISDERKSGFLVPQIGYGSRVGAVAAAPYYFNLAPQLDDTLTPRWLTDRGLQLENQFRYLGRHFDGRLETEYLAHDKLTGENRAAGALFHRQTLSPAWSALVDLRGVSDKDYFSDFGDNLGVTSQTHLPQNAELNYRDPATSFTARLADYQTVDRTIAPTDRPYARLPQLVLGIRPSAAPGAPHYRLDSELVNFDRDVGVTGERMHINPAVAWPLTRTYGFFTPEVGARYIAYRLQDAATERPAAGAPYLALDTGLYFDRDVRFAGRDYVHTLEPRLYYLYVPFRAQDDHPNFDTSLPDLSFGNLFRTNRFVGGDRIGDANQLTLAVTTRLNDQTDGTERLRASIGQIRYFEDRRVNIPPATVLTERSDLAAELVAWLIGNWHLNTAIQWNPSRDETERASYYLQYQPARDRILNIGQRFVRNELEQFDVSTEWPLGPRWSLRARSLYSQRDHENVESYAGVQYNACCWALRFHGARRLLPATGSGIAPTESREFMLELELSGFGKLGAAPVSPLAQGLFSFPPAASR